ncbi:hypothetical protein PSTT_07815 [Puccinia striiformis]|uniref:Uncharacterized protein n=1 Tax=Puccinia striiformis TaxID=27350 RepID=A0A2S4VF54_9BASI|nr:hypothetical protein PSTT_07815 [Puccinia striiformis]
MNPADSYQLGDHLTIDQVDQWLKEATESRRSLSSSPTSDLEVDIVDIVGSHSTSTTGSVKRGADEQASDPNEDKIKISLEYKLHVPKKNKKPASTRNSNKRKATTTASAQNYTKLISTPGSLSFLWPESDTNLAGFKAAAIAAIKEGAPKGTGAVAEKRENKNAVLWYVAIAHGGIFQAKNKTTLKDDAIFAEFLVECEHPRQGRVFTINIFQPDLKVVAEQQEALDGLEDMTDDEDDDARVPTTGAVNSNEVIGNTRTLMATHMPCERLTGSNDLLVMIDPSNNDRFIPLTQERISLWARTMVVNKEVTFTNPPNSPPFKFITTDEYHKKIHGDKSGSPERSTSQNHIGSGSPSTPQGPPGNQTSNNASPVANLNELLANHPNLLPAAPFNGMHLGGYMGMPPNPMGAQIPAFLPGAQNYVTPQGAQNPSPQGFPITSYVNNPAPPSSPAPSDKHLDLDDYFRHCHVNVACQLVRDAIDTLGISHYTNFENFEVAELHKSSEDEHEEICSSAMIGSSPHGIAHII